MTSAFRRSLTKLVLSPIKRFIDATDYSRLNYAIPGKFKLRRTKESLQFQLGWKRFLQLIPELEDRLVPESLLTYIRNEDRSYCKGITDIQLSSSPGDSSLVFTVDQNQFAKVVLREFSHNSEDVFERSCFFNMTTFERVVIDYSSPNIAKPFHYGHFRSTIIGKFFDSLFRYVGHDVVSINYVGDWGLQYGILAAGFHSFGSETELKRNPVKHLHEVYVKANQRAKDDTVFASEAREHFKRLELGEIEAVKQWERFKAPSLKKMSETYKSLCIFFTETHSESMYANKTDDVLSILLEKNVASKNDDGSIQVTMKDGENDARPIILKKKDGSSLYLSRDLAAAIDREKRYHFDSMYYVVDSSQKEHFSNLFRILKEMGCQWHSNLHFLPFGRISNFSTRKGNAIYLQDIIDEAQERTLERIRKSPNTKVLESEEENVAFNLAVSSLIINDLCFHRTKEYEFDWDKVLSMTGNSGFALQYCHARLTSLKANCGVNLRLDCDLSPLVEPQAIALIDVISRFDEALYKTYERLEPVQLVNYLFHLKAVIGSAHKVLFVKDEPLDIAQARLMMFYAALLVLGKGLRILNIQPLKAI